MRKGLSRMIFTKGFYITQYLMGYIMKEYFKAIENLLSVFTRKEPKPHVPPFDEDFIKMMNEVSYLDYEHPCQRRSSSNSSLDEQELNLSPSYFTKFKPLTPKLSPQQSSRKHVPYLDLNFGLASPTYPVIQDITPIAKPSPQKITMDRNDIGWITELHKR